MKFTKLNNKSDENFFTEFKSWLQSDLSLVNKTIFENLNNDSTLISDLSNHIINAGGKRIRPLLTLTVAKLCKYSGKRHINWHQSLNLFILPLFFTMMLSIIAQKDGGKTANVVWGNKSSILVGVLLSKALKSWTDDP